MRGPTTPKRSIETLTRPCNATRPALAAALSLVLAWGCDEGSSQAVDDATARDARIPMSAYEDAAPVDGPSAPEADGASEPDANDAGPRPQDDAASGPEEPEDASTPLEPDAAAPDAAAAADGAIEEAPDGEAPPPPPAGDGETCVDAPDLRAASAQIEEPADRYDYLLDGALGATNDYNPLRDAELPPGCALAFDASGNERVFALVLQPGETLDVRLELSPISAVPALYLVTGCPVAGWPDIDGSGLCGNNEYATEGFCQAGLCGPLEWSFTWPEVIDGLATAPQELYLVVDEVGGATADTFALEWGLR